ncbi:hypothetical protein [Rufibacter ruber]|uniref:hypothetical protein n=1 Tax=Rufibacter ruber TaxID=1783499 RepID=UPI0012904645|nr:hypothetical protein [Rufibacter ruber]
MMVMAVLVLPGKGGNIPILKCRHFCFRPVSQKTGENRNHELAERLYLKKHRFFFYLLAKAKPCSEKAVSAVSRSRCKGHLFYTLANPDYLLNML